LIYDRVEHDAGLPVDIIEHFLKLLLRAHKRVDVLDRADVLVLRGGSPPRRQKGLACGIGNQMQMKEALRLMHIFSSRCGELLIARRLWRDETCGNGKAGLSSTSRHVMDKEIRL